MKNFALNALALIVGVAISLSLLVAADFWMQGLANEKLAVGISVLRSQDDLLHHKFNPLASAATYWGTEKVTIHTNSLAMRDDSKRHVFLNKSYFLERFIPMNAVFHKTGVFGYSRGAWTYDQRVFDLYRRRGLELATRYMDQLHKITLTLRKYFLIFQCVVYLWMGTR
jgi:hypothetical protein